MTIFVKTLTGKTITINGLNDAQDIYEIMLKIQESEGIPADQCRLIFAGKQLMPFQLISDTGLENESTIHMVLRLRGDGGGGGS